MRDIFGITLSRTEIDRREEAKRFPKRHKAGDHPNSRVFYVRSEVAAWVKSEIAKRMKTSRAQLDRLLDPDNESVTLGTLTRAAQALGRHLRLELV